MTIKNKILNLFLGKKIRSYRKDQSKKNVTAIPITEKIKSVLILKNNLDTELIAQTKSIFKNATLQTIVIGNKENNTDIIYIGKDDLSLTGKLKNLELSEILKIKFDLVIDLSEKNMTLTYLLYKIKSLIRVGKSNENKNELPYNIFVPFSNNKQFMKQLEYSINLIALK